MERRRSLWLVDLIAPFANTTNKHIEIMTADLISKPLRGRSFHFHRTDPATGARTARRVEADAGEKLAEAIAAQVACEGVPVIRVVLSG